MLLVVVVDVVGAIDEDVVDWSVVVVFVMSGPPQPATNMVPAMSATPIRYLRPYFVSVMGNSVSDASPEKSVKVNRPNRAAQAGDAAMKIHRGIRGVVSDRSSSSCCCRCSNRRRVSLSEPL